MIKRILIVFALLAAALQAGAQTAWHIQQRLMEIPHGQYSGITRLQDDVYAVVHDKAPGGGLYIFTIAQNTDGTVGAVNVFKIDADGPKGRDNEDVVFVPETETLFVSAEGDQSIREYSVDGKETGRQLTIPEDLKKNKSNAGFEALAYADGTFWTTTESPLPGQTKHIIQSFNLETLQPGSRFLYQADEPSTASRSAAKASAFVYGISAMTVLPDGQLAVMEREVYVPGASAGFLQRLIGSFTRTKIYTVNPADAKPGELLEKKLLTSFTTSALSLANFEGMCLGPVLEDGGQTLLLIADSQDGKDGLTGEYLRVLAIYPQ
ncbi:MAG: esterase-like activity of phytase family protein [Bacteroidales bacterium]|nr:esterase-like activity of phytase family protein [Bacteroidales bacterium]